jgi:3-phenylpropionate/cinnamic acid dioxygenase small subunit
MIQTVETSASEALHASVYQFLCHEGAMLDNRRYLDWLNLCTEDITYVVTMLVHKDSSSPPAHHAIIDEAPEAFRARVEQIATPKLTHAENPPTIARRFFSNLVIEQITSAQLTVSTNLLVSRARPEVTETTVYSAARSDTLRRVEGEWRLARRIVHLDHAILQGAVSIIF